MRAWISGQLFPKRPKVNPQVLKPPAPTAEGRSSSGEEASEPARNEASNFLLESGTTH